ncbi:MAG: FtsX-like permease family protein, partial [Pseudomonadota bacterium]
AMYQDDTRLGQLFSSFAGLAIVIACLGLFGLATFNAQRRIKEIGVRKVMGGSVWSIVLLLTNDFSKLVLLSNLIAWPVAYFAMERWLQNFAYRIDLTPLVFIGSGLIALCIAWVTVGGTAAKAASAKPVLALRYE